ncbi:ZDS1 [[Candida] subhashii]|uniref:ZDS1 n=1 Tax=[Candida] subhashii TaxID=561895 RepID=A0A8J5QNI5_9ASCO|nr:ZDS1 [[Candida] subhashii]KAG7666297.1 ZDS1 [[Candida] subhashii]
MSPINSIFQNGGGGSDSSNYESAVQDIEQEKKMVAALKRLSLGHTMQYDPDLLPGSMDAIDPFGSNNGFYDEDLIPQHNMSNMKKVSSPTKLSHQTEEDTNLKDEVQVDDDSTEAILDSSQIWVPANMHPQVNPESFKSLIKSQVEEILERRLSKSSNISKKSSLSRQSSLADEHEKRERSESISPTKEFNIDDDFVLVSPRKSELSSTSSQSSSASPVKGSKRDSWNSNRFSNPSLRDLTNELEQLSRRAGMDKKDTVTLARTLSTAALGYTDVEKMAMDEMTGTTGSVAGSTSSSQDSNGGNSSFSSTLQLQQRLQQQFQESQIKAEREAEQRLISRQELPPVDIQSQDFALKRSRRTNYRKTPGSTSPNLKSKSQPQPTRKPSARDSQILFSYKRPSDSVSTTVTGHRASHNNTTDEAEIPYTGIDGPYPTSTRPMSFDRMGPKKSSSRHPEYHQDGRPRKTSQEYPDRREMKQGSPEYGEVHSRQHSQEQLPNRGQKSPEQHYPQQHKSRSSHHHHVSSRHNQQDQSEYNNGFDEKKIPSATNADFMNMAIPHGFPSSRRHHRQRSPGNTGKPLPDIQPHQNSPIDGQYPPSGHSQYHGPYQKSSSRHSHHQQIQQQSVPYPQQQHQFRLQHPAGQPPKSPTESSHQFPQRSPTQGGVSSFQKHHPGQSQQVQTPPASQHKNNHHPHPHHYQKRLHQPYRPIPLKSHQLNENLDLLRSEINEFKESLNRSESGSSKRIVSEAEREQQHRHHHHQRPEVNGYHRDQHRRQQQQVVVEPTEELVREEPREEASQPPTPTDISFDVSYQDLSIEDQLGLEKQALKELGRLQPEESEASEQIVFNGHLIDDDKNVDDSSFVFDINHDSLGDIAVVDHDADEDLDLSDEENENEDDDDDEMGHETLLELEIEGQQILDKEEEPDMNSNSKILENIQVANRPQLKQERKPSLHDPIVGVNVSEPLPLDLELDFDFEEEEETKKKTKSEDMSIRKDKLRKKESKVKIKLFNKDPNLEIIDSDNYKEKMNMKESKKHKDTTSSSSDQKTVKKSKSFGLLTNHHHSTPTSPENDSGEKKVKKKKSWGWLRERSASVSSVDMNNLPPLPETKKTPIRSVSSPEVTLYQQQAQAEPRLSLEEQSKENVISKLFKKKSPSSAAASIHSGEGRSSIESDAEHQDSKVVKKKASKSLFKKRSKVRLVKEHHSAKKEQAVFQHGNRDSSEEKSRHQSSVEDKENLEAELKRMKEQQYREQQAYEKKKLQQHALVAQDKQDEPDKASSSPEAQVTIEIQDLQPESESTPKKSRLFSKKNKSSDDHHDEKNKQEQQSKEQTTDAGGDNNNNNKQERSEEQEKLDIQEKLRKSIKRTSKANQPIEFTDSAFGFPLPPPSNSTLVMLDYRFPVHVERAIYRLSHLKLANPKRSLREQVLLSNFMYAYLNLVDHTLHLEQQMGTDDSKTADDIEGDDDRDGDDEEDEDVKDSVFGENNMILDDDIEPDNDAMDLEMVEFGNNAHANAARIEV